MMNSCFESYFKDELNYLVIVAISAGIDSSVLLHSLDTYIKNSNKNITIIAAHFIHGWGKEEEDVELRICQEQTTSLGIKLEIEYGSSEKTTGSKEADARNKRHTFLEKIRNKYQAHYIFLAHHQDDQIETFFINLIRGANIQGLLSIKKTSGFIIHPFLNIKKEEIIKYQQQHSIPFFHDKDNNSNLFLRNRIRNNLIPIIQEIDGRSEINILKCINRLNDINNYFEKTTEQYFKDIYDIEKNLLKIDSFLALDIAIQKNLFFKIFIHLKYQGTLHENLYHECIRFFKNSAKKHQIKNIQMKKSNGTLIFFD